MLAVGVGAFLVRDVVFPRFHSGWIYFHGLIFAILLMTIASLSGRWRPSLEQLRMLELGLFATIVVSLVLGQFLSFEACLGHDPLEADELRILFKNSILGDPPGHLHLRDLHPQRLEAGGAASSCRWP